jgi:hypothetical protein
VKRFNERYLAGVLEARGHISLDPLIVSLRMKGPIPKFLHKQFGGTFYIHVYKGKGKKKPYIKRPFFRVVGKSAFLLLSDFEPYLILAKSRVSRYLQKQAKQRHLRKGS